MNSQHSTLPYSLRLVVAATACSVVLLELLLSRMYVFFLGSINAYLAIPVAMFGLGLGSLYLQFRDQRLSLPRFRTLCLGYALCLSLVLPGFFLVFNRFFHITNWFYQNPHRDYAKLITLASLSIPPFALAGMILAAVFREHAKSAGRFYGWDLIGSSLACVLGVTALHFLGLPPSLALVIAMGSVPYVALAWSEGRRGPLGLVAWNLAVGVLAWNGLLFNERIDPNHLTGPWRYGDGDTASELYSRWDDISRVALVDHGAQEFKIYHDEGVSTVALTPYRPGVRPIENRSDDRALAKVPFLLDEPPRNALVLFAGAGRDMIALNAYAPESTHITGVELSPLIPTLISLPWVAHLNLASFFSMPNIRYVIDEGRSFLERHPQPYDLIFVGTNGATFANRFGSTRKYLDTLEAQELLLERLSPRGMILFHGNIFFQSKLKMFKALMPHYSKLPFEHTFVRFGWKQHPSLRDNYLFRPSGFSDAELQRVHQYVAETLGYPFFHPVPGDPFKVAEAARAPSPPRSALPSDDRPYYRTLDVSKLFSSPSSRAPARNLVFQVENRTERTILFGLVFYLVLTLAVLAPTLGRSTPLSFPKFPLVYFLATGIAYMWIQITLMARFELFLGVPLYAMTTVLGTFLLMNGVGALLFDSLKARGRLPDLSTLLALALGLVFATYQGTLFLGEHMGLPLFWRVLGTALCLTPLSVCLGFFYPYGVECLRLNEQAPRVPLSFAISTLSSVLGGITALVLATHLGYRNALFGAATLYLGMLALLVLGRAASPRLFRT